MSRTHDVGSFRCVTFGESFIKARAGSLSLEGSFCSLPWPWGCSPSVRSGASGSRAEYQRRERQQQVLRLFESDLSSWILSRCGEVEKGTFAFEVRQSRILLPRLNVYLAADRQPAAAPGLPARDANLWCAAQAVEFRGGETAAAIQNYRRLLSGDPAVSSWSKLALLRLALQRAASSDAAAWLKEIQDTDQAAVTESGIPIRVVAALLLIEHDGAATISEAAGFLSRTLSQLASG